MKEIKKEKGKKILDDFLDWFLKTPFSKAPNEINLKFEDNSNDLSCVVREKIEIIVKEIDVIEKYFFKFKTIIENHDFLEFYYYYDYMKSQIKELYGETYSFKHYPYFSNDGQKESNLFLYIFQSLEKIAFKYSHNINLSNNYSSIENYNEEIELAIRNQEDSHKMIKKTIKNISFGKSFMYSTLSKSLLWGNFKNYNIGIAETRNQLLHHDMFMHMRLPEKYRIPDIFENYRNVFYIEIMPLFFIYIYYVSHYIDTKEKWLFAKTKTIHPFLDLEELKKLLQI